MDDFTFVRVNCTLDGRLFEFEKFAEISEFGRESEERRASFEGLYFLEELLLLLEKHFKLMHEFFAWLLFVHDSRHGLLVQLAHLALFTNRCHRFVDNFRNFLLWVMLVKESEDVTVIDAAALRKLRCRGLFCD